MGRTSNILIGGVVALFLGVASGDSYSYSFETMCSNGLIGVESSNGLVCCAEGCGTCGGVGCSQFGAPDLDAFDCCVTEILDFGEPCSETEEAPCFINDHWVVPVKPTAPMVDDDTVIVEPPILDVKCSNGLVGVESSNGLACCDVECGFCGGSGCSRAGGPGLGATDCCSTEIVFFGEACSETKAAPCFIDGPIPTLAPTSAPMDDDDMEMSFSYTYEMFDDEPSSSSISMDDGSMMMCSNGVYGIESSNGLACCPEGCGQCGGVGCSQAGAPDYTADDCCTNEILDFGWACSVTGTAPCVIDGDTVMMPEPEVPTLEDEDEDLDFDLSYDYSYMM